MTEDTQNSNLNIVQEIITNRQKILEDFARAYLASLSFTEEVGLSHLIQHIELHEKETRNKKGEFGFKYWFEIKSGAYGKKARNNT
jgi:hypothetical protein